MPQEHNPVTWSVAFPNEPPLDIDDDKLLYYQCQEIFTWHRIWYIDIPPHCRGHYTGEVGKTTDPVVAGHILKESRQNPRWRVRKSACPNLDWLRIIQGWDNSPGRRFNLMGGWDQVGCTKNLLVAINIAKNDYGELKDFLLSITSLVQLLLNNTPIQNAQAPPGSQAPIIQQGNHGISPGQQAGQPVPGPLASNIPNPPGGNPPTFQVDPTQGLPAIAPPPNPYASAVAPAPNSYAAAPVPSNQNFPTVPSSSNTQSQPY
ncbi:hypothetical protein P154DRAFT_540876 [Amniculicola lignicola CBS 123094]|uniref:Uncharacterized protein n=1 Tax=Amniculicola lignicola CBS 123094 TaxID=1392246 RepID=A0A6A5VU14_9PLEO|nr:hypothetical protein P154DRAFT_540876 [Amniculicola lignicola CBS 123094]